MYVYKFIEFSVILIIFVLLKQQQTIYYSLFEQTDFSDNYDIQFKDLWTFSIELLLYNIQLNTFVYEN